MSEKQQTPTDSIATQAILGALDTVQKTNVAKQKVINAATIQEQSTAELVAQHLHQELLNFQANLLDSEDMVMSVVQFNESVVIRVLSIGYIGYSLIRFLGTDNSNKPLELIQHVSQLNFLLETVPRQSSSPEKHPIGFLRE